MNDALFDIDPADVRTPEPTEVLSPDRRRTLRQAAALARGVHPLALALGWRIRLHPDAAPADDRKAPGLRCGTCRFREVLGYHSRSYPKCAHGAPGTGDGPRMSHGAATDVRGWWPACTDHEPSDPKGSEHS